MRQTLSISIDLDGPLEYHRIHGFSYDAANAYVMYQNPLNRFLNFCESLNIHATIFVISRDITDFTKNILVKAMRDKHELADHSAHHDFNLHRQTEETIVSNLESSKNKFKIFFDSSPSGFRAPAYLSSPVLLKQLSKNGFLYDSSYFPSPWYFLIKNAFLLYYKANNIPSASSSHWANAFSSQKIHFLDKPCENLIEIPLSTGRYRFPLTGATLLISPQPLRTMILKSLLPLTNIVLGLHIIEFCDLYTDKMHFNYQKHHPELKIPIETRMKILKSSVLFLMKNRINCTLKTLALDFKNGHDSLPASDF